MSYGRQLELLKQCFGLFTTFGKWSSVLCLDFASCDKTCYQTVVGDGLHEVNNGPARRLSTVLEAATHCADFLDAAAQPFVLTFESDLSVDVAFDVVQAKT